MPFVSFDEVEEDTPVKKKGFVSFDEMEDEPDVEAPPREDVSSTISFPTDDTDSAAAREVSKFGLSAPAPAGKMPQPVETASLLGSVKTGAKGRAAERVRESVLQGIYGDPFSGPMPFISREERQRMEGVADKMASDIAPTYEETEAATRTLSGKAGYGAGSFLPDAPEYLGAGGFTRTALTQAIPKMAGRRIVMPMVADTITDIAMQAKNVRPEDIASGGAATEAAGGIATNLMSAPTSVLPAYLRAPITGMVGYGVGKGMGMSDMDAASMGATHGAMMGAFGAEGPMASRSLIARPVIERIGNKIQTDAATKMGWDPAALTPEQSAQLFESIKRYGLPEFVKPLEANVSPVDVSSVDPVTPVPSKIEAQPPLATGDITPAAIAAELGVSRPKRLDGADRQAFLDTSVEYLANEIGMDPKALTPQDRTALLQTLRDRGFDVQKRDFPVEPTAPKADDPKRSFIAEEEIETPIYEPREPIVRDTSLEDPTVRSAMDDELSRLQRLPREAEYTTEDGRLTTIGQQRDDLRRALGYEPDNVALFREKDAQRRSALQEARDRIRSFERGESLGMNPVGLVGDYLTVATDRIAKMSEPLSHGVDQLSDAAFARSADLGQRVSDAGRERVPQFLREKFLDSTSAAHDFERAYNISIEDSPRARFFKEKNALHRLTQQLTDENSPTSLLRANEPAIKAKVLPQAKRLRQIDSLIEAVDTHETAVLELMAEADAIRNQPDITPDMETRLSDIEHELKQRGDVYQLPDGATRADLEAERDTILNGLDGNQRAAVDEYSSRIRGMYDHMMDALVQAGRVSQEAADKYKQAKTYMPFYRILIAADDPVRYKNADSVRASDVLKSRNLDGSELGLMDPTDAAVVYAGRVTRMIDENEKWSSLADLPKKYSNIPSGMIRKVNPHNPGIDKLNEATFRSWKNGVAETYAAPKDVVRALEGVKIEQAETLMRIMTKSASLLRAGATGMYLPFATVNLARDIGTAAVRGGVWNPVYYVKALADIVGDTQSFRDYVDSGATMSGPMGALRRSPRHIGDNPAVGSMPDLRRATEGTSAFRTLEGEVPSTPAEFVGSALRMLNIPWEFVGRVIESGENIPRKAVWDAYKRRGAGDYEAMMRARNVTTDFGKVGTDIIRINQIVPFFNVAIQGAENLRHTFMSDPARGAARAVAVGVMPALVAAHWAMTEYPEVYAGFSDRDKKENLIIPLGHGTDPETGEYNQIIKVPKPEILRPIMNATQYFVERQMMRNPESLGQFSLGEASRVSPIPFAEEGKVNPYAALDRTPPIVKVPFDIKANTRWSGGPIVPQDELTASPGQQYDVNTPLPAVAAGNMVPGAAKLIADLTGAKIPKGTQEYLEREMTVSPRKLQYFVENMTGGLGRSTMQAGDTAIRSVRGDSAEDVDRSAKKTMSAFTRRFSTAYPRMSGTEDSPAVEKAEVEQSDIQQRAKRAAQRALRAMLDAQKLDGGLNSEEGQALMRATISRELEDLPSDIEREAFNREMDKQVEKAGARASEVAGLSAWGEVQNLPEDERAAKIEELLESQNLDNYAKEVLVGKAEGKAFVSAGQQRVNERLRVSVRARAVLNILADIKHSDLPEDEKRERFMSEVDRLTRAKMLTPKVDEEIQKLFAAGYNPLAD